MVWFVLAFPFVKPLYFEQIPLGQYLMLLSPIVNSVIEAAIYNQVVMDWNYNVFYDYPYALQMDIYAADCNNTPGDICLTNNEGEKNQVCKEGDQEDPVTLAQTCYRRKRILGIFPTDKIDRAVIYMPYYDSTHISWTPSPDPGRWHGPTIVRHEIAHVVGLGHDRDDLGSLLMKPVLPPGEYRPIDNVVRDAVYCKYGPPDTYTPPEPGQAGLRVLGTGRQEVKEEKEAVTCPIFQIGGCGYVPPSSCDMDSVVLEVRDSLGNVVQTWAGDPDGCVFQRQWISIPKTGRYQVQATVWFSGQPVPTASLWIYAYPSRACLSSVDQIILATGSSQKTSPDQPYAPEIRVIPGGVRLLLADD